MQAPRRARALLAGAWAAILVAGAGGAPSCWQGPFSFELCCDKSHGPGGNAACWDEFYTFAACCVADSAPGASDSAPAESREAVAGEEAVAGDCWHGEFTSESCCETALGPEGNPECWDEVYTYAKCCQDSSASSQAAEGCAGPYFSRFRRAVVDYYESGTLSFDVIKSFGRLASDFSEYFEVCAPAVLQALLLQQEERAALDPPEVRLDLRTKYTLRLQQALTLGRLSPGDNERWPLKLGLERVHEADRESATALAERRFFGGGLPNITLVVAYCREPLDWMRSSLARSTVPLLSIAIVRKCRGVDVRRALPMRAMWRSVDVVDVEDAPLIADECSAYLGYLAQRHHRLPEYMFFIHGDAPEHIGALERPNFLDDSIRAVLAGARVPFLHLSSNRVTMGWDPVTMGVLWRGLFGDSLAPGVGEVHTYCCAHFVVSRERALLRTKDWYSRATQFLMSTEGYSYLPVPAGAARPAANDVACNLPCQNMMFLWHIIFGEKWDHPHRMFDVRLPLFARLRNVRLAYLEGDGPTV